MWSIAFESQAGGAFGCHGGRKALQLSNVFKKMKTPKNCRPAPVNMTADHPADDGEVNDEDTGKGLLSEPLQPGERTIA